MFINFFALGCEYGLGWCRFTGETRGATNFVRLASSRSTVVFSGLALDLFAGVVELRIVDSARCNEALITRIIVNKDHFTGKHLSCKGASL